MRSFQILGAVALALSLAACGSESNGTGGSAGTGGNDGGGGSAGMDGGAGMGGSAGESGAAGMGGSSGMGGSGGVVSAGVCDNSNDLDAIANAGDTLRNIGGTCGTDTCGSYIFNPPMFASCISSCLESEVTGLSSECSSCYGEVARCGLSAFCLDCGNDTCSADCLSCLNGAGCLTALDACTGIPTDDCP